MNPIRRRLPWVPKHDETYMPKEVADKMGKAHMKHDVANPAPGATQPATMEAP